MKSEPNGAPSADAFPRLREWTVLKPDNDRLETLGRCLQLNHERYAPLFTKYLLLHNHVPHVLGSAYYMGVSSTRLVQVLEARSQELIQTKDLPSQPPLDQKSWKQHLGQKEYTAAYVDYFDAQMKTNNGNWRKTVDDHIYEKDAPLLHGMVGGLIHPFIHLAYAYEFDSASVASEALSLACTEFDHVHTYFTNPPAVRPTYTTRDLGEIMDRVRQDKRFDGLFDAPGAVNIATLHSKAEEAILEHWQAWTLEDVEVQFADLWDFAVKIAIETASSAVEYDFFLIHELTGLHAIRVILPHIRPERWCDVLRQYWVWCLLVYVAQLRRPYLTPIKDTKLSGRDWKWVEKEVEENRNGLDAHWTKVVRALKVGSELYPEQAEWHLQAAVKFITEYGSWTGFGKGMPDEM